MNNSAFRTFYIVFGYILLFSVWWGYLLFQKNETAYEERVEILALTRPGEDYTSTAEYAKLTSKYNRQKLMISLEGGVFIALMLFGFLRVKKVFKHEMELAEQQKNFLLSITHELRSPISTVKLSLQTMEKRKLERETEEKLIKNSLVDVERLQSLVDNILFAAKIEHNDHGMRKSELDISHVTSEILNRYLHNNRGIMFSTSIAKDIVSEVDAIGYTSMVVNLVENAIKYSPENTKINVSLTTDRNNARLTVADEGVGIPEAEREKIFEKFYRIGSENTRTTKGTGLGLYIVKRFVEIHNGEILVSGNSPKGTVITVQLPLV